MTFSSTWIGGFAETNLNFAYPDPNLTSLKLLGNMENINELKRQQEVQWPEFSWETKQGHSESRCFQMFAPDISRLGYDNQGRVFSIICPQQGAAFPGYVVLNVEVTVTGQRGWVDEPNKNFAADMTVEGSIWFSATEDQHWIVKHAWDYFKDKSLPFPSNKENAIKVTTHEVGNINQGFFSLRHGQSDRFENPKFAVHPEAFDVGNLSVQIGTIRTTGHEEIDNFNQRVLDIFNLASGNMLQNKNILTWNVWFTEPGPVNTQEWQGHADKWRKSLDANHGPVSSPPFYADHSLFKPEEDKVHEIEALLGLIKDLL